MIPLTLEYLRTEGVSLIRECMGDLLGDKAVQEFEGEEEYSYFWGLFDIDKLVCLIGFGLELSPHRSWLGWFCVDPKYRGKGFGTKALEFLEDRARNELITEIFVETYTGVLFQNASRLYEKNGYIKVGYCYEYLEDGTDAIFYRKVL